MQELKNKVINMDVESIFMFFVIMCVICLVLLIIAGIIAGVTYGFSVGYEWDKIESYFWLSDSASSPEMKVYYLNQFIDELNKSGISGYNSAVLFPTPRGKADNIINQVVSLRDRVAGLINHTTSDYSYATEWKQINDVEYCWIQLDNLECAYAIKNGWGIMCLTEPSYSSICYSSD